MKDDIKLEDLLYGIKLAVEAKDKAERAIIDAEHKRKKAQYNYLQLMETFRAKEFII